MYDPYGSGITDTDTRAGAAQTGLSILLRVSISTVTFVSNNTFFDRYPGLRGAVTAVLSCLATCQLHDGGSTISSANDNLVWGQIPSSPCRRVPSLQQ